ncbi:MAG: histidinol-phosphate transaminase [Thermoprotei archaeon]|nr:MAG: histidinol-phosphate transaminase [Thermoprotei archaeon]
MTSIADMVRDSVKPLRPYEAFEPPPGVIELDANENLVIDEAWAKAVLIEAAKSVDPRLYPKAYGGEALRALSEHLGVDERNLAVSNGSDELIEMAVKAFIDRGNTAVIVEPTFEVYGLVVSAAGGLVKPVLVKPESFELDVDSIVEASREAKLVFLCSPNNPTGVQYREEQVAEIAERCRRSLVVVDEAYADFAGSSLMELALRLDNVLVLRSLSKSAGMAGLRIGYAVSSPQVIEALRKVDLPFRVNSVAQRALGLVLADWRRVEGFLERVRKLREELFKALSSIEGVKPYPSKANFLLVRVVKQGLTSSKVYARLLSKGFLVRDRGKLPLLENCLRITVGPKEVNERLVEALREVVEAA